MSNIFSNPARNPAMERVGFRFGPRGTHGSRTIMPRVRSGPTGAGWCS